MPDSAPIAGTPREIDAGDLSARYQRAKRFLFIDVDNQRRWIGSHVEPEVHIPPVALLMIATVLKQEVPAAEVRVVSSSLDAPTDAAMAALLDEFKPDVVALRSISFFFEELSHVAAQIRAWDPEVPVIVGGPVVSSLGRRVFERCADLDVGCTGEGEFVLPELISGLAIGAVRGLIWRDGEDIHENPPRPLIPNLDDLPFADHSLIDMAQYEQQLSYAYNHRRQGILYTSRGCIFRCSFCFQPSGVGARYRSAENVFEEIKQLHDVHGVRDFYVIDDIFNVKRRRAMAIFRKVIAAGLKIRFYFVNGLRADLMDDEHIDLMIEAGTVWVTYAIESVNPDTQKLIRKEMNTERAERSIRRTQEAGVVVNINTMFGFPHETRSMADETLDWIARLPRPSLLPYHFCLKGYEGCDIVDQAEEAGWDIPTFLGEANKAYNHVPPGSPTFSRVEMIAHLVDYHDRYGIGNLHWMREAVRTLRHIGYSDRDLIDMYTVLLDRPVRDVAEIVPARQLLAARTE